METYSKPLLVEMAFKDFFLEAIDKNRKLEIENKKLQQQIYILESKLITIKIAIDSFNER